MTEQRATYDAGDTPADLPADLVGAVGYTMHLTHLELIALNRSLNCRLQELRRTWPDGNYPPPVDQTYEITAGVLRRVDKLLRLTR